MGMGSSGRGLEAVRRGKLVVIGCFLFALLGGTPSSWAQTALTGSILTGGAGAPNAAVLSVQGVAGGTAVPVSASAADPCAFALKSSVVVNTSVAATAQLVAAVAGQTVRVCGFAFSLAGTTPTVTFVAGTGAACATGPTNLTGAMAAGMSLGNGGATLFSTPLANALCITTTGTAPSAQGVLTYVQQ